MKILIDTREQAPYAFRQYEDIQTERGSMPTGDYSLPGLEGQIAVERKSLPDLVQCLGRERQRFVRELERARALQAFCVVIEGRFEDLAAGRYKSSLNPAAAAASIAAFMSRYGILFFFAGGRELAERFTQLFLRQYAQGKRHELKAIQEVLE